MPNDRDPDGNRPNGARDVSPGWDPERDPARLSSLMRRSGYTADQFARLMAEVAAAEAAEADRRGLPGLAKIRDTVTRQTVERWAKGQSPPRGWWSRFALIVMERLEQTLDTGFEAGNNHDSPKADEPTRRNWIFPVAAAVAVVGAILLIRATRTTDGVPSPQAATTENVYTGSADPRAAPVPANDDPGRPSGAGCDPAPAVAWWKSADSEPLADGAWFGRVMDITSADPGYQMILDIACYYDQSAPGSDIAARIEPGSGSVDSPNAIRLQVPGQAVAHWPDGGGVYQQTDVATWLDGSSGSTDPSRLPVLCPSGWCSVWVQVDGGVVTEIAVADFAS